MILCKLEIKIWEIVLFSLQPWCLLVNSSYFHCSSFVIMTAYRQPELMSFPFSFPLPFSWKWHHFLSTSFLLKVPFLFNSFLLKVSLLPFYFFSPDLITSFLLLFSLPHYFLFTSFLLTASLLPFFFLSPESVSFYHIL